MNDFVIYTDSACDIPPELLKEWGVPYSWLTYVFEGDARQYSNYELPFPEFYDRMRKGSVARTSAVNADAFVQGFEPILQDGKDILYIGFSSGLSGTYHAGCIAAQDLRESVVLLLGDLEERDIVKEKLRQTVRRQMKKFTAGTVKKHFFQRLDLAANANTFHDLNLLHSVIGCTGP